MATVDNDLWMSVFAKTDNELNTTLMAKWSSALNFSITGVESTFTRLRFIISCIAELDNDLLFYTKGKTYNDLLFNILGKPNNNLGFLAFCESTFNYIYHFVKDEITGFKLEPKDVINEVTIRFGYDFVENKPRATITKHNPISKAIYGDNSSYKKTYEMQHVQDQRFADKLADAILKSYSLPPVICSFTHNVRSFYVEENDRVAISHPAGFDLNGYTEAGGYVKARNRNKMQIDYEVLMKHINTGLLDSELVKLTIASGVGRGGGISIEYEAGVLTATVYANIAGNPPLQGVTVRLGELVGITNVKGQTYFNVSPGTYTAYLTASGYEDKELTFTI